MENVFSEKYLWAKATYLKIKIAEIPRMTTGIHNGYQVINVYSEKNGKTRRTQHRLTTSTGKNLLKAMRTRQALNAKLSQLYSNYAYLRKNEFTSLKPPMMLPYSIKSELTPDCNPIAKTGDYWFKGIQMRSRLEILTAAVIDSLGLEFMYEPRITINGRTIYPDFVVFLPELGCCFIIECLGKTDDLSYMYQNSNKISEYLHEGYELNNNLLLFSGTNSYVPDPSVIKADIVHLINNLAHRFVVK